SSHFPCLSSCYPNPPDLLSFPTRRSSDLPVPPSAPSTMMKSGVMPVASMALQIDRNSERDPTHSLKPTGFPSASVRRVAMNVMRSEEHTSELQSRENLVCRLLLEKKKKES